MKNIEFVIIKNRPLTKSRFRGVKDPKFDAIRESIKNICVGDCLETTRAAYNAISEDIKKLNFKVATRTMVKGPVRKQDLIGIWRTA